MAHHTLNLSPNDICVTSTVCSSNLPSGHLSICGIGAGSPLMTRMRGLPKWMSSTFSCNSWPTSQTSARSTGFTSCFAKVKGFPSVWKKVRLSVLASTGVHSPTEPGNALDDAASAAAGRASAGAGAVLGGMGKRSPPPVSIQFSATAPPPHIGAVPGMGSGAAMAMVPRPENAESEKNVGSAGKGGGVLGSPSGLIGWTMATGETSAAMHVA
mmetsp:Transcript_77882/g.216385  ORF Transcript_77882/g.216385 Transcript_77882/m.216385 type:complete len:213 (+) Transcript_77882:314-952(+)